MTKSWTLARHESAASARLLADILDDETTDTARLISAYLASKRDLADAFQLLGEKLYSEVNLFDELLAGVGQAAELLELDVPAKYRRPRFGQVHRLLYTHLVANLGNEVTAAELRMLTGDAVHTERRARDLRDLGLIVVTRSTDGQSTYTLVSSRPNAWDGARRVISRNIRDDKTLSRSEREHLLKELG